MVKHANNSVFDRRNFERFSELEQRIKTYDASLVNVQAKTVPELYSYFYSNSDAVYQYVRLLIDGNEFAVSNEIRAMLGHLAEGELNCKGVGKHELKNAYGHFRRMNIDVLKMLCDELDKALSWWLQKHYHYDYRKQEEEFLPTFSENYVSAKRKYKKARLLESVGSDSKNNKFNIIELYYQAACAYIDLFALYRRKHAMIEKKKWRTIFHYVCCAVVSILLIAAGFIP